MESKIQSLITDLGVKELNHPNLPENSLRLSFLLYMGSVFFHPTFFFYLRSDEKDKLVI